MKIHADEETTGTTEAPLMTCMAFHPTQEKDLALSKQLSSLPWIRQKQCWKNAVTTLLADHTQKNWHYVEGACLDFSVLASGFVFEHGWLTTPDMTIVDPTRPHHGIWYIPVKTYSWEDSFRCAITQSTSVPFVYAKGHEADRRIYLSYFELIWQELPRIKGRIQENVPC